MILRIFRLCNGSQYSITWVFDFFFCVCYLGVKPTPNDSFLDWTKFKAFADDKLNAAEIKISVFDIDRKHCGKKEKMLVTSIFSYSLNVFKIHFFQGR